MFQIGDWVDLGEGWVQLRKVTYSMPSDPNRDAIVYLNDYECEWVWDWFDKSKHRSVDGPFMPGDRVSHNLSRHTLKVTYLSKESGEIRVQASVIDPDPGESVRHYNSTPDQFKLVKPVEAIEQEKESPTQWGDLNEAISIIEYAIAPNTLMGTDVWRELTNVWAILLNVAGQNTRLIQGKTEKPDFDPYLDVLTEGECRVLLQTVKHVVRESKLSVDGIISVIADYRDAATHGLRANHVTTLKHVAIELLQTGFKRGKSDAKE